MFVAFLLALVLPLGGLKNQAVLSIMLNDPLKILTSALAAWDTFAEPKDPLATSTSGISPSVEFIGENGVAPVSYTHLRAHET